ncbi:MAG: AAA family ATPase [Pseudomonas fluorescens]|nr:MAG: AAA family ATPase [Pseudomonas fluorescens]
MQRIMIVGISGAGKSTLSRFLGHRFNLPYHHLDNIYHSAGWVARPLDEVKRDFDAIAAQDKWVVDGNYRKASAALRERADIVIFLDYGRLFAIWQVVKRWAFHHLGIRKRPDLPEGSPEQLPLSFIAWVWNWHANNRPNWVLEMANMGDKARVFTSRRALNQWMKTL